MNLELSSLLASLAPQSIRADDPLGVTAAKIVRSSLFWNNRHYAKDSETVGSLDKGAKGGCVLIGMRKPEYVEDVVTGVMGKDQVLRQDELNRIWDSPFL